MTGYHYPPKRGKQTETAPVPSARGAFAEVVTRPPSRAKELRSRQGKLL